MLKSRVNFINRIPSAIIWIIMHILLFLTWVWYGSWSVASIISSLDPRSLYSWLWNIREFIDITHFIYISIINIWSANLVVLTVISQANNFRYLRPPWIFFIAWIKNLILLWRSWASFITFLLFLYFIFWPKPFPCLDIWRSCCLKTISLLSRLIRNELSSCKRNWCIFWLFTICRVSCIMKMILC